jgi:hypothetical protein
MRILPMTLPFDRSLKVQRARVSSKLKKRRVLSEIDNLSFHFVFWFNISCICLDGEMLALALTYLQLLYFNQKQNNSKELVDLIKHSFGALPNR